LNQHLNITVTGSVQGVFFRASTQKIANGFHLKGFVKNQPDGTVYIEVEGPPQALEKFTTWCQRGPDSAHVQKLDVSEGTLSHFTGFNIRY